MIAIPMYEIPVGVDRTVAAPVGEGRMAVAPVVPLGTGVVPVVFLLSVARSADRAAPWPSWKPQTPTTMAS